MLASKMLVRALCDNFAEAAEPEASTFLLSRLRMSKETEPDVPLACVPILFYLCSMLHQSKSTACVLNDQALTQQDQTHHSLFALQKIEMVISKGKKAGLIPVPSAYSSLLKAYGKCRQWPKIKQVLIRMVQSGVPIDKLHCMAALRAYHISNRSYEAEVGSVEPPKAWHLIAMIFHALHEQHNNNLCDFTCPRHHMFVQEVDLPLGKHTHQDVLRPNCLWSSM